MLGDASFRALLQVRSQHYIYDLSVNLPVRGCSHLAVLSPNLLSLQVFGYLYPGYLCYKDVESKDIDKLRLWCMYW